MAAYLRLKRTFPRLKSLFQLQRFNHTLGEGELEAELLAKLGPKTMVVSDTAHVDTSKWRTVDSRKVGVSLSMIPDASRIVLRILQKAGYDAYLVGGCIRDLLLKKAPKDFDVITTATLQEIKKKFNRAFIVGRRFPICQVHVKGSIIEVSSFTTVGRDAKEKENAHLSKMPKFYDEKDILRWRDSLKRDFTINSLFYDPFADKIYDYSSGMTDLMSLKLRTVVPANLSFKEDCARILRGLRIAARLGLSFAEDTERAIHDLYASAATLDKARLMMEMNYMLSYGAAQASLLLLQRFNLLEVLLPFQAAYLANHSGAQNPLMLMELVSNLDNVVSCDQPCDSGLWVSLLAFHLALVRHPQDALVVWTFSSVLFHGNWKEGVKAARELAVQRVNFVPEILESSNDVTDKELAKKVTNLASIVQDSIGALNDPESLIKAMGHYRSSPSSLLVFISKKAGREVAQIFSFLVQDIESRKGERLCYSVDYKLLGKGGIMETRFVLGKVIMDTMRGGLPQCRPKLMTEKKQNLGTSKLNIGKQVEIEKSMVSKLEKSKGGMKRGSAEFDDELNQQRPKNQKQSKKTPSDSEKELVKEKILEIMSTGNVELKNDEQQKKALKEVKELRSLQKQLNWKDGKLERGKHGEAEAPEDMLRVLEKAPKMAKEQKVESTERVFELEKPKSKDRVKRGSGETDDQLKEQRSKKKKKSKKLVKEKMEETLSIQDISQKNQQQKEAVKEVEKLPSLQKKLNRKDAKLDKGKHCEAESLEDILSVLEKAPKMTKEHKVESNPTGSELETAKSKRRVKRESCDPANENELHQQRPKKQKKNKNTTSALDQKHVKEKVGAILGTRGIAQKNQEQKKAVKDVEKLADGGKDGKAEAPKDILSVLEKAPKMMKELKAEGPKGILNVLRDSNLFKREKEPIEKDAKDAQDQKVGEQTPQRIGKLSSIFK